MGVSSCPDRMSGMRNGMTTRAVYCWGWTRPLESSGRRLGETNGARIRRRPQKLRVGAASRAARDSSKHLAIILVQLGYPDLLERNPRRPAVGRLDRARDE